MTAAPDSIYLDYAASAPVDPEVARAISDCLSDQDAVANASSEHAGGARARAIVETARAEVAARVGAPARRILFTSGATESNNLALKGMLGRLLWAGRDDVAAAGGIQHGAERRARVPRPHLVTTRIEHRSVLDTARALAARGVELTLLDCDEEGRVPATSVAAALREDTALVSVMHVNNEIGSIQDIAAIAAECRARGVPLHVDAAQSVGKLPLDVTALGIDLCSLSAHKLCGPKGVGALYVREGLRLEPLFHGGDQELGMRAGTLATHQIVGMGRAYVLADPAAEGPRLEVLRERLWAGLAGIPDTVRNGSAPATAPHILNVSFPGVDGESLRLALEGIAVSSGSACSSASPDASHVLTSLGASEARALGSLRFGVGRFTTPAEIDAVVERVAAGVMRLRALAAGAPAWCSA